MRLEPAASEVKGKCANHLATEAPYMQNSRQNYFVQGILQDEIIKVMYLILQKILITMSKTNN